LKDKSNVGEKETNFSKQNPNTGEGRKLSWKQSHRIMAMQ
jgi:hypothetical protein